MKKVMWWLRAGSVSEPYVGSVGLLFLVCANDSHTPLPYQSEGGCSMFLMGTSPFISAFK